MSLFEMTSLVIGVVVALMVIVTIRADHDRRKKQSTMDTAALMLREAREVLQQEFDTIKLTENDLKKLKMIKFFWQK